jgi:hypothetical protein
MPQLSQGRFQANFIVFLQSLRQKLEAHDLAIQFERYFQVNILKINLFEPIEEILFDETA